MKTAMQNQQENVKSLLELVQANPDLRIIPLVDSECVPSDDYGYWVASWGKPEIDDIWADDEKIYCKSTDYDDLVDRAMDDIQVDDEHQLGILAKAKVDGYEWEKVIVVKIDPH